MYNVFLSNFSPNNDAIDAAVATEIALEEPRPEPRGMLDSIVILILSFLLRYSSILFLTTETGLIGFILILKT